MQSEAMSSDVMPSAEADHGATTGRLGIVAAGGALPRLLAEAERRAGREAHVVALRGLAGDWIHDHPHSVAGIGQVGRVIAALKRAGCRRVCMAGGLARPALFSLWPDATGLRLAPRFIRLFRKGDDGLLRGVAQIFEERGFAVIGAADLLGELLAPPGALGTRAPSAADLEDIGLAARIVAALGPLDIGQGAVVARRRCLAIETVQGTDAMLEKLVGDRRRGGAPIPSGVLFKAPKPDQDRRLDLPTIGPATLRAAKRAGLDGVAVAAGEVFVLDPAETARVADAEGLFVYGWDGAVPAEPKLEPGLEAAPETGS